MKKKILSLLVAFIAAGALSGCGKPPAGGSPGDKETEKCGNEKLDAGEKCDKKIAAGETGACPTAETCQDDGKELSGEADKCTAECVAPKCGNGKVDAAAGETCDTKGEGDEKCLRRAACEAKAGSDGNHKWVYSGKYSDCTAKCEEVEADCNDTAKDGFCPEKCTSATDKDCHSFWDECESDTDCPQSAPYCASFLSLLNIRGQASPVKRCTVKCEDNPNVCDNINPEGSTAGSSCLVDIARMVAANNLKIVKGYCAPNCSNSSECGSSGMSCEEVNSTSHQKACVYQPKVETNPAQLTKPCDPSDASTCEGGQCISGYYGATGPDSGFCSAPCGASTPEGLYCSQEDGPTDPKCELIAPANPGSEVYSCFAGCQATTDCVAGSEYCAKIAGETTGVCRRIPKNACEDKAGCEKAGAPATKGLDCVDNVMADAPSVKFCVAPGTGTVKVGYPLQAAQTAADCKAAANKAVLFGPNMCTQNCAGAIGEVCPADTVCAHFNNSQGYCFLDCKAGPSVCPSGTQCSHAVGDVMVCLPTSP